jgi:hypothetical protein
MMCSTSVSSASTRQGRLSEERHTNVFSPRFGHHFTCTSFGGHKYSSMLDPRPTFSMNAFPYSNRCVATVDQNRPAGVLLFGF